MEIAASFFYISAGLAIWVIGALVVIILIELVKALKAIQTTAQSAKESIASLESWKTAIISAVTSTVTGFITKKSSKGGGNRDSD